jgi:hypothetical protein
VVWVVVDKTKYEQPHVPYEGSYWNNKNLPPNRKETMRKHSCSRLDHQRNGIETSLMETSPLTMYLLEKRK